MIIVKCFFTDLIFAGSSCIWKETYSFGRHFLGGLSQIRIVLHSGKYLLWLPTVERDHCFHLQDMEAACSL